MWAAVHYRTKNPKNILVQAEAWFISYITLIYVTKACVKIQPAGSWAAVTTCNVCLSSDHFKTKHSLYIAISSSEYRKDSPISIDVKPIKPFVSYLSCEKKREKLPEMFYIFIFYGVNFVPKIKIVAKNAQYLKYNSRKS